jgi:hypothetical protein
MDTQVVEERSVVNVQLDDDGLKCVGELLRTDVQEASNETGKVNMDTAKALDLMGHIRELLAKEMQPPPATFARPLTCDYPLKESLRRGYHGYCDIQVHEWETESDICRKARSFDIRSVSLQLNDAQGALLPVELLLPTFIHELAHTVTCPERRRAEAVSDTLLKLQPHAVEPCKDGFLPVHHSDTFYANFAELLRAAERLEIYTLPAAANKFGAKSLMRFDAIDPVASLCKLNVGHSPLFATAFGATSPPLRILITDAKRTKQKPMVLHQHSIAEVLAEAKQRLNLRRRPTSVSDASGRTLNDELLASLKDGDVLIVT